MLTILSAIFPVFALIGLGVLFGRARRIDAAGVALLNSFTVWLALPALLFRSLAAGDFRRLDQPGFILAFGGGTMLTFLIGHIFVLRGKQPAGDRSLAALAASYSNTAFIGIPLAGGLLGPAGVDAGVISTILTASALFAVSVLIVEIASHQATIPAKAIVAVARSLIRNPLIIAPVAGGLWAAFALPIPTAIDRILVLLSAAASPTALITIGAFLALPGHRSHPGPLSRVQCLKLLVQPLLTALIVLLVSIPHDWATAAILLAALPTGTGPFMLAELYRRQAALASRTILISTILGAITIAILARAMLP